jgi:hypothetical protein
MNAMAVTQGGRCTLKLMGEFDFASKAILSDPVLPSRMSFYARMILWSCIVGRSSMSQDGAYSRNLTAGE